MIYLRKCVAIWKRVVNKARKFYLLEAKYKLLYIEAFFYLLIGRFFISVPFDKVSPYLGTQMKETPYSFIPKNKDILQDLNDVIEITSRYTFWQSKCLVRAIAGMKMLERRKIECTLYLGIAKDENGKLIAHAWLRSGLFYVTGSEGMESFTVVGKFAKQY